MPDFPSHVRYALMMLNYGLTDDADEQEARVEQFRQAWGGTDAEALARAAQTNGDEFALLSLGRTRTELARDVLLPFLDSPDRGPCWASAMGLAELRDPAALPVLAQMLAAYDPTARSFPTAWDWPLVVPDLLARWAASEVVPVLRSGLEAALVGEQKLPPPPTLPASHAARAYWPMYQYSLVYALGRVSAFGALVGVPLPPDRMDVARVQLLAGSLYGQYDLPEFSLDWRQLPNMRDRLAQMLERIFGLNVHEQNRCLHAYAATYGFGGPWYTYMTKVYGNEEEQSAFK